MKFEGCAAFIVSVLLGSSWGNPAAAEPAVTVLPISIPSTDHATTLTGEVDLPIGLTQCEEKGTKVPAILMVPGSGEFDRDEDFGTSGTDKDRLFRELANALTAKGLAVVRQDYRGVHCNRFTLPAGVKKEDFFKTCVDKEARKKVSPKQMQDDFFQFYDYAAKLPCVDASEVTIFGHSEATFHVAHLIHDKRIAPRALVFMGMVAESPKSLVHWQFVERTVDRIMKFAAKPDRITLEELRKAGFEKDGESPKGYWTRAEELEKREKEYAETVAKHLAVPDETVHRDFWSYKWWKMWWADDERSVDLLKDYPGEIVAHEGDEDTQVPGPRQHELLKAETAKFKTPPKLVLHPGKGHSLGKDGLMGPIAEDSFKLLVDDLVRVSGVNIEKLPYFSEAEIALRPYMGILFELSDTLPKDSHYKSEFGLKVSSVTPGLPAWDGGIRAGDILLGMDGEEIGAIAKENALVHFIKRIQAQKPGGTVVISLLRWKTDLEAREEGKLIDVSSLGGSIERIGDGADVGKDYVLKWRRGFDVMEKKVAIRVPRKMDSDLHPDWDAAEAPEVEQVARRSARRYGKEKEFDRVKENIREATERPDPFRLAEVDYLQHHPFQVKRAADAVLKTVVPSKGSPLPLDGLLVQARRLLAPRAAPLPDLPPLETGLTPPQHLARIRMLLSEANGLWDEAYKKLTPEEITFLRRNLDSLVRKFEEWNYVYKDTDRARLETHYQVIHLAAKVDLEPLIRGARSLARLTAPEYVRGLKADLKRAGLDLSAKEVLEEKTPFGEIVIAGTGDDWHIDMDERGMAVLIDLGGNDVYGNRAGSSTEKVHASVVVDLEGDDVYESNQDYSLGAGYMGIGILADLAGNDSYLGIRGSQGTGFLGVGLLIDRAGDDHYRAHSMSQGFSFMGVGGLADLAGNDRYDSRLLSQAVAVAGGVAGLLDLDGNDRYFSRGFIGSGYGTPGTFEGWSQGVGIGVRNLASGGVGILYDGGGDNVMEGGDFSQGGGYYFGWGILKAGQGNDKYVGSRYAQGFAAHEAIGTFIEDGGNDFYDSRMGVTTGNANDLSISWFEDRGGNDRYPAKGFSLGAAANNSVSIFIDRGGKDRYVGTEHPANGNSNDYRGGTSIALALDLGGSRASGPKPAPAAEVIDRFTYVYSLKSTLSGLLREGFIESLLTPPDEKK